MFQVNLVAVPGPSRKWAPKVRIQNQITTPFMEQPLGDLYDRQIGAVSDSVSLSDSRCKQFTTSEHDLAVGAELRNLNFRMLGELR